jgi:hypothetical protein
MYKQKLKPVKMSRKTTELQLSKLIKRKPLTYHSLPSCVCSITKPTPHLLQIACKLDGVEGATFVTCGFLQVISEESLSLLMVTLTTFQGDAAHSNHHQARHILVQSR